MNQSKITYEIERFTGFRIERFFLNVRDFYNDLSLVVKDILLVKFPSMEDFTDFADTAAAIAQLDLIITIDTSVAHLAGAMGKPTWVLLCHNPDWRWQLDGDATPWYPSLRLFRQPTFDDWDSVFAAVSNSLSNSLSNALSNAPNDL